MLLQIQIENIAIIDSALIDFNQGYHVLTGETGAGKSIILDSLGLLTGDRAQKELIRKGEEQATVKGIIGITDENRSVVDSFIGAVEDDYLMIERVIYKDGKSVAKINGKIVPLKQLREIVLTTIEICGQKSHIDLMKEEYYRNLVDDYSRENRSLLEKYQESYKEWKKKKKELEQWNKDDREQEQMFDLYQYQIQEIEEADLKEEEEEELEIEGKRLSSFEKLNELSQKAVNYLEEMQQWYVVENAVEMISEVEEGYDSLKERVLNVGSEIDDIRRDISRYHDTLEYDEGRLNDIVSREEEIKKIKRKYGNTVQDVLSYYQEIQDKMLQYERKEEVILQLQKEISALEDKMEKEASVLHKAREKTAKTLSENIEKELKELAMPHAEFFIDVQNTEAFNEYGKNDVQAYFNANKGEEKRHLNKIASGGEMARVLLAIKVVINEQNPGKTLIFDEVDEGIGGDVGRIIGEKMKRLGANNQVVVISHLPQVASKASHHFRIEKKVKNNRTFSTIEKLSDEERIQEIARMLYGDAANDVTLEQAKRMLIE